MKRIVPPIKSQGIKTKLSAWIEECLSNIHFERWVEPFMGTGAVALNIQPKKALLCDSNPHLIRFYQALQDSTITPESVRAYLTKEGKKLELSNGEHYYFIRERFNTEKAPLDFLFLSRSCFNGMMRFNKKGGFNVPFCKKPQRFAPALITKITNQVKTAQHIIQAGEYIFKHQSFEQTLQELQVDDLVYADPPYIGRHVDYFDSWSEEEELVLYKGLQEAGVPFALSTWLKNKYRTNEYVFSLWKNCHIATQEHFYHVGGKEKNRNAVYEALLSNYPINNSISNKEMKKRVEEQKRLLTGTISQAPPIVQLRLGLNNQ